MSKPEKRTPIQHLPERLWRSPFILPGIVVILGFILRVHGLDDQSLWYDELATWNRAVISLSALFEDLFATRNHMPLYFLLMRLWSGIGTGEFILRAFSVVWGMVSIALIYSVGRFIAGRTVGLIAALFLAISPFHIWYSQEARMYSFAAASILLATWFFLRLLWKDRPVYWLGYTLSMIVAVYTHYLAILILVAHYTFISLNYRLLKSFFRKWLAYAAVVGLIFSIWVASIMLTGGFKEAAISWIASANWFEPFYTLLALSAGSTIDPPAILAFCVLAVFLAGLLTVIVQFGRFHRRMVDDTNLQRVLDARLLLTWLVVPVVLIFLVSLPWPIPQRRSIYVDRYLIISLPALILLAAWGLTLLSEKNRPVTVIAILVIAAGTGASLYNLYRDPNYSRDDWRSAWTTLSTNADENDVILGRPDHVFPMNYYANKALPFIELPAGASDPALQEAFKDEMAIRLAIGANKADRAWLITHFYNNDPHGFPQARNEATAKASDYSPQKAWMDASYNNLGEWEFTGINLALYDLNGGIAQGQE